MTYRLSGRIVFLIFGQNNLSSYLRLWQDGLPPLGLPQQTPLSLLQTLLIHLHLSQDHLKAGKQMEIRETDFLLFYFFCFWVHHNANCKKRKVLFPFKYGLSFNGSLEEKSRLTHTVMFNNDSESRVIINNPNCPVVITWSVILSFIKECVLLILKSNLYLGVSVWVQALWTERNPPVVVYRCTSCWLSVPTNHFLPTDWLVCCATMLSSSGGRRGWSWSKGEVEKHKVRKDSYIYHIQWVLVTD